MGFRFEEDVREMLAHPELKSPVRHRKTYKNLGFDDGFLKILKRASDEEKEEMRRRSRKVLDERSVNNSQVQNAQKAMEGILTSSSGPSFVPLNLIRLRRGDCSSVNAEKSSLSTSREMN